MRNSIRLFICYIIHGDSGWWGAVWSSRSGNAWKVTKRRKINITEPIVRCLLIHDAEDDDRAKRRKYIAWLRVNESGWQGREGEGGDGDGRVREREVGVAGGGIEREGSSQISYPNIIWMRWYKENRIKRHAGRGGLLPLADLTRGREGGTARGIERVQYWHGKGHT